MLRGFSLLELLICIVIIGVISALATSRLPSLSKSLQVKHEAESLKILIENLTLLSQQKKENQTLKLSLNSYLIKNKIYSLKTGINLTSSAGNLIIFYSSGVNTPSTIKFSSESKVCKLVLSLRGRVQIKC